MLSDSTALDCGAPPKKIYPKMDPDTLGNCADAAVVLLRFSESVLEL